MPVVHSQAKSIFGEAIALGSPEERTAFLARVCAGDTALRAEVESLLEALARANGVFPRRPSPSHRLANGSEQENSEGKRSGIRLRVEAVGSRIGPYKLVEQLGEGGMGLVFVAEQQEPMRRRVALKVIKPGMDTRQVIARFEAERQALALMDHPNIARVLDAGATESGRPFFVMELVNGVALADYCDQQRLTIRRRLDLFLSVCHAVQHAHQKGIIHRDLKPSNVMVGVDGVNPSVKVIDFGIAKATGQQLTDKTLFTAVAQMLGTPQYMSPEQAGLNSLDVDTRTDIYSLGVLLYELLTGTTPFEPATLRKAGFDKMLRIVREQEPPSPSSRLGAFTVDELSSVSLCREIDARKLKQELRGELDWIVMKALEKDRDRRYESASALAADIERFLRDDPVLASPPSTSYRLRKFVRRNRNRLTGAGLLTGVCLFTVYLIANSYWHAAGRMRETSQDVNESLAGARAAFEAGDLVLAGRRAGEARARLGTESAGLPSAALEIDRLQKRIGGREAALARLRQFLAMATESQEKMAYRQEEGGDSLAVEALDLYEVLKTTDWLSRVQASSSLTAQEVQQIRETAYVTLVSLADFHSRWPGLREDPVALKRGLSLLERALAFHEPTRAFYFARKQCHRRLGNDDAAEADLESFKAASAQTAWDYYLPGHTAGWEGDLEEAMRGYHAALALQPNHYNSLFFLGDRLGTDQIHRWPEAIAFMTACIALRPDHVYAHLSRASYHQKLGHCDEAEAGYTASIAIAQNEEDRFSAYAYRWRFYRSAKRTTLAEQDWDSLLKSIRKMRNASRQSSSVAARARNFGDSLRDNLGNTDLAMVIHREAIHLAPHDPWNHIQLAYDLYAKDRRNEAEAAFREGLSLNPTLAGEAHSRLYSLFREREHLTAAIAAYRETTRQAATSAQFATLGALLVENGELLEAVSSYREAIRARPGIASNWISLAEIYKKLGNLEQTIASYQAAARLETKNVSLQVALGATYREGGAIDSAIACFREAVRQQPNHRWAQVGLNLSLLHKGDVRAAIAAGRAALPPAMEHDRDGINYGLGFSLQAIGERDAAVVAWRAALRGTELQIKEEPTAWEAYILMSRILSNCDDGRLADPQRAVDLAHRGLELCQQQFRSAPKSWYTDFVGYCWANLGLAYYRAGNWTVAARAAEKAASLLPDDAQVVQTRLLLACVYGRLGQLELARKWYNRATEWLDRTHCKDPTFQRLKAEAAGLLHLNGMHVPTTSHVQLDPEK